MTLLPAYFDRLYADGPDPWGFRTRWYEARKRALTIACLPDRRYRSAFEPGCSIGVLTDALAERCDHVLAMDVSDRALAEASAILPSSVSLVRGRVPDDWPGRRFDLVVVSEIGYYFEHGECQRLAGLAAASAGDLVAVHWRHPVDDYPLIGDDVHEHLAAAAAAEGMTSLVRHLEEDFLIDVWSHDPRSVARRTRIIGL